MLKSRINMILDAGCSIEEITALLSVESQFENTKKDIVEDNKMTKMLIDGKVKEVSTKGEVCYSTENDEIEVLNPFQSQLLNMFDDVTAPKSKKELVQVKEKEVDLSPYAKNDWSGVEYKRGDVVHVRLNGENPIPGVQDFERYGVIIQNNTGNRHAGVVIIAMMTSVLKKTEMPTHVVLEDVPCLPKKTMVMCEQIRTISKAAITKKGTLPEHDMKRVDKALAVSISLDGHSNNYSYRDNNQLQAELEKIASLNDELEQEKEKVASLNNELEQEKEKVASLSDELQQEKEKVSAGIVKSNRFKYQINLQGEHFNFSIDDNKVDVVNVATAQNMTLEIGKIHSLIEDLQEVLKIAK